jgi:hypothetical protein
MFRGDVQLFFHDDNTFIDMDSLSKQFKQHWREQRNIRFTWESNTNNDKHNFEQDSIYWSTMITNECVSNGQIAYFEVKLEQGCFKTMIGAVTGSNSYKKTEYIGSFATGMVIWKPQMSLTY